MSLVLDENAPALLNGVDVACAEDTDNGDIVVDIRADLTALRRDRGVVVAEVAVVGDINVRIGGPFKSVR